MRKLNLIAIWILLMVAIPAYSSSEEQRHSVWRVQSEQGTLYLAGSVHLLKPEDYPLPTVLDEILGRVDALALEIDLGEVESLSAQLSLLARGLLTDGRRLEDILNEDTMTAVKEELATLKIDYATVQFFKPWMLMMTLAQMRMQALGFDPEIGVDRYCYNAAKKRGIPIHGLETAQFQIDMFDVALEGLDNEMVMQTLAAFKTMETELDKLLTAWKTGDMETLGEVLFKSFKDYPKLEAALLTDRNRNWLTPLTTWLESGKTVLVVAGAGHFPGPDGLIALLEAKGYRIEQL